MEGRAYEPPPIFTKTYDFVGWMMAATAKFPANYRTSLTSQIENKALRLMLLLGHAIAGRQRAKRLAEADELVEELRLLLRLAFKLKALRGAKRYGFVASNLDEIGRMIGGWRKKLGE